MKAAVPKRALSDAGLRRTASPSLFQQVKLARIWLPLLIVGVVLGYQLAVVPLGGDRWQFWAQLLFYSILGPVVTFITLDWIAAEVQQRESAQTELQHLYGELKKSHALLGAIQQVTERFASATDLETLLSAATQGVTEVTGARGTAILLSSSGLNIDHSYGLSPDLADDALRRDRAIHVGKAVEGQALLEQGPVWVLSMPLIWAGRHEGSAHAYFNWRPGSEQRETFGILCGEFSAAAEATRARTRDLVTLFDVDRSIRAEGNLERLLETLLSQMVARADASAGGVYLADEANLLRLRACHCLPKQASGYPVRLGEGLIGQVALQREPHIITRLSPEEKGDELLLNEALSVVALPLMTEEELLGVVVLTHESADHFDATSLPFLGLVAGQVSLAVRNARAYLQSEELAIAEERARIAREIHDGVAQSLAFSALKLDLVTRLVTTDLDKAKQELKFTKNTLREMIKEVRRSIFALSPIELERHGFVETLRRYGNDFGQQNDVQVTLDIRTEHNLQLSLKSEALLFRIFQEAMHNVAKHARASEVDVGLSADDTSVSIEVRDNGCGFDLKDIGDRVTTAGGLGLRQMKARIESRGGVFEIDTRPGEGTRVRASLPV